MGYIGDQLKALFTNSSNNNPVAASGARVPVLNSQNAVVGSDSVENVAAQLAKKGVGGAVRLGSNVFIATVEDNYYRFYLPENYSTSKNNVAVGVLVRDGDNHIIIAKDYAPTTLKWANSNVDGGTAKLGRTDAWKDHDGRAKTATVIATLGENAPAAKFCADYYPANMAEDNAFYGKGRWWMPAAGDLWMMYAHFNEINYALSLINGTLLVQEAHWSIAEGNATSAWGLSFSLGSFYPTYKEPTRRLRPVSAFY